MRLPERWSAIALINAVMVVMCAVVHAQEAPAEPQSAEQKAFIEKMRALDWVKGPATVTAEGNAKLTIPEQYVYLDARNTSKFLEMQHNLGNGREVMVAPRNLQWMAYLEFADEGYVKDNEKIDATALLKTLKVPVLPTAKPPRKVDVATVDEEKNTPWVQMDVVVAAVEVPKLLVPKLKSVRPAR